MEERGVKKEKQKGIYLAMRK